MYFCLMLVGNYGASILLFTLLTKVILFPLSVLAQKNSITMVKMAPALNNIQRRYESNKELLAEERKKLYKKEHYSTITGLLPTLIQIPIILGLIAVIYNPLTHLFHLDSALIAAFIEQTVELTGVARDNMGFGAEIFALQAIQQDPAAFTSISSSADAIAQICALDTSFLGLNLMVVPTLTNLELIIALTAMLSALLLCLIQNRYNVLQANAGFLSRYGLLIFLVVFSGCFAFMLPASFGLYWTASNIFSVLVLFLCNLIYSPKAYMTPELKASQQRESREARQQRRDAEKENNKRSKKDYQRFMNYPEHKEVVFYSEASGFYKYFKGLITRLLAQTDITIHYLTSDPADQVFSLEDERLHCYYLNDRMLINTFMRMDTDIMVLTTPDLETYHLKRSLVNKNVEYIYMNHGSGSLNFTLREHALDHFDTVFCYTPQTFEEVREIEYAYKLPQKTLVKTGFELYGELKAKAEEYQTTHRDAFDTNGRPLGSINEKGSGSTIHAKGERADASFCGKVLIAPSWQPDNIMESCAEPLVRSLLDSGLQVVVRPHPEFVKRFPERMESLRQSFAEVPSESFILQDDFSDNSTLYTADLIITDWSTIFMEFCYTTKQPALFINTPTKIPNPNYERIPLKPLDLVMREKLGTSLSPEEADKAGEAARELIAQKERYRQDITTLFKGTLYEEDRGMQNGADYIAVRIKQARRDRDRHE